MELINHHLLLLLIIILVNLPEMEIRNSLRFICHHFRCLGFGHHGFVSKGISGPGTRSVYLLHWHSGRAGLLNSFKSHGLKLTMGAIVVVTSGFLTTWLVSWLFGYGGDTAAGAFADR